MRILKEMNNFLTALTIVLLMSGCATFDSHTADDFADRTAQHKSVAILPFLATVDAEEKPEEQAPQDPSGDVKGSDEPEKPDPDASNSEQQKNEPYLYQQALYTALLERSEKIDYTVEFQDTSATNVLLKRNGIEPSDLHTSHTKSELASLLGVDAVVSGSVIRNKPASAGASIATTLITGLLSGGAVTVTPHTKEVNVSVTIHDGADSSLLWNFDDDLSGGLGSSFDRITEWLMNIAAKEFPYVHEDS